MEEPSIQELTDVQKRIISENWKLLEASISRVGVITFLRLFETHPDVQGYFPSLSGMEMDELRQSKQLQTHALKVMGFIQKVVARLYEPNKLNSLIRQLGRNHFHYGAKDSYIDYVGPQFVYAIKPSLEDHWSEEAETAWISLFQFISHDMKIALNEARQDKASATSRS